MSTKLFSKFWVALTAIITLGLLAYLFPLLLNKCGFVKAVLLACLIPVAMTLAYFRGYWVSTMIEKNQKQGRDS